MNTTYCSIGEEAPLYPNCPISSTWLWVNLGILGFTCMFHIVFFMGAFYRTNTILFVLRSIRSNYLIIVILSTAFVLWNDYPPFYLIFNNGFYNLDSFIFIHSQFNGISGESYVGLWIIIRLILFKIFNDNWYMAGIICIATGGFILGFILIDYCVELWVYGGPPPPPPFHDPPPQPMSC